MVPRQASETRRSDDPRWRALHMFDDVVMGAVEERADAVMGADDVEAAAAKMLSPSDLRC